MTLQNKFVKSILVQNIAYYKIYLHIRYNYVPWTVWNKEQRVAVLTPAINFAFKAAYSVTMNIFRKKNIFFLNRLQK